MEYIILLNHGFFQPCPGHHVKYYWCFGWTCPVCVLVCMTVWVGLVGERNCADVACCIEVWLCLGVCCCCLISWDSWSICDCRLSVFLLWAMAFSSLHLTWVSTSSSLLWASSLTIWQSLWCCMLKFCLIHSVLILCLPILPLISLILKGNIGVGC